MDLPDSSAGGGPSPGRRELQGPRPTRLRVSKDSHKIMKPPVAPHPSHAPPRPQPTESEPRQPMIIYAVSPRVIHTTVSDFMLVVQRLTGSSSSSAGEASLASGAVSPAARLASIEKTSPSEREKERERAAGDLMGLVEGVEVGQIPGILTPAPATLMPISSTLFSPASDPNNFSCLYDLSPFLCGNSFMPSPSSFLSAPLVSPTPSPDFFSQFPDF